VADRVEHQRDPRERLDRPVVEEQGEPSSLVLLGCDQLLEQADALALLAAALALPPLALRWRGRRPFVLSQ